MTAASWSAPSAVGLDEQLYVEGEGESESGRSTDASTSVWSDAGQADPPSSSSGNATAPSSSSSSSLIIGGAVSLTQHELEGEGGTGTGSRSSNCSRESPRLLLHSDTVHNLFADFLCSCGLSAVARVGR